MTDPRVTESEWPKILVLYEKHTPSYYLCEDRDALLRASLEVVAHRLKTYVILDPGTAENFGVQPQLSEGEISNLPASYAEHARGVVAANALLLEEWEEQKRVFDSAKRAVAEADGALALYVLRARRHNEYEGFTLVTPHIPTGAA